MRKLSEQELIKIQKAIAVKDLTSAEILMEVYDHYVSHLENKATEEFDEELSELEQKFTRAYCHEIQAKFLKSSKKELYKIQWSILKSYLTWPRLIGTLSMLIFLTVLWNNLEGKARGLAVVLPMAVVLLVFVWILIKSKTKVNKIKRALGQKSKIQSSYLSTITIQFIIATSLHNLFFNIPKNLGFEWEGFFESYYFIITSFSLCLFYIVYAISLLETWKIKSKTALI